jgi:long-chain acyl-CoA synthetase
MGRIFDFITLYKEKYAKDIMVAGRDGNGPIQHVVVTK